MEKNPEWIPVRIYCCNCGVIITGYKNLKGIVKFQCSRCGTKMISTPKGNKELSIKLIPPTGYNNKD